MTSLKKPYFGSDKRFYPEANAMWEDFCSTYKVKKDSTYGASLHRKGDNSTLFDHTGYYDTEDGQVIITQPYSSVHRIIEYFKKDTMLVQDCINQHCNVVIYANHRFNWRVPTGVAVVFHFPKEYGEETGNELKITAYDIDPVTNKEKVREFVIKAE